MDQEIIIKLIKQDISDLQNIVESFSSQTKILPLEIEICSNKLKNLQEEFSLLKMKAEQNNQNQEDIKRKHEEDLRIQEEIFRKEQERIEFENIAIAKAEKERLEKEELEQSEKAEKERREKESIEIARLEAERIEKARLETVRIENERIEKVIKEAERKERERIENEKQEADKKEKERLEKEQFSQEKLLQKLERSSAKENSRSTIKGQNQEINPIDDTNKSSEQKSNISNSKQGTPPTILADQLAQKKKKSLHESLAENRIDSDLATQLKSVKIDNIHQAIPLNDRIWFIKELFNGNSELYQKTVDRLNLESSLSDALDHIQSEFDWDGDARSVQKFLRIISRKFN